MNRNTNRKMKPPASRYSRRRRASSSVKRMLPCPVMNRKGMSYRSSPRSVTVFSCGPASMVVRSSTSLSRFLREDGFEYQSPPPPYLTLPMTKGSPRAVGAPTSRHRTAADAAPATIDGARVRSCPEDPRAVRADGSSDPSGCCLGDSPLRRSEHQLRRCDVFIASGFRNAACPTASKTCRSAYAPVRIAAGGQQERPIPLSRDRQPGRLSYGRGLRGSAVSGRRAIVVVSGRRRRRHGRLLPTHIAPRRIVGIGELPLRVPPTGPGWAPGTGLPRRARRGRGRRLSWCLRSRRTGSGTASCRPR